MLGLLQLLTPQRASKHEDQAEQAHEFLGFPAASRVPLHPPTATNDDPLQEAYVEVERELQVVGYLR